MHDFLNKLWFNLGLSLGKISNEVFKIRLQKSIPFWLTSFFVGLIAVAYSKLFGYAESLMKYIFTIHPIIIFIQAPILMLAGWFLVKRFAPNAGGSGIPQVMAAIDLVNQKTKVNIRSFLSIRIVVVKIVSSMLMVLGGAAIGREGPTIQISSSIFDYFNRLIPKGWPRYKRSSMIVAGAAAGLAAAFNTPLGGIVFAIEELSKIHVKFYRSALFLAVIISGITAQGFLGSYLYLGYPSVGDTSWFMFIYVIVIAVVGGLLGSILGKGIITIIRWRKRVFTKTLHSISFIIIISLIISTLAYFVSYTILGSGKDIMQQLLFSNYHSIKWYDFPLRFIGSLLSFSSGAAGGIFAPALSAGATLGALLGSLLNLHIADTHLVVLAGMVAFLTSITRTPFTSAIIVLEMTDRSSIIFYLLIAGIFAGFASRLIDKKSLYDHLRSDYLHEFKIKKKPDMDESKELTDENIVTSEN